MKAGSWQTKGAGTTRCWDCGSTIEGHHTALCDMADAGDILDLPAQPGTQWWTGEVPAPKLVLVR